MKILREDITQQGLAVSFTDLEAKPADLGDARVLKAIVEPPRARLRLNLMRNDMVRVEGAYSARLEAVCSRCLSPLTLALAGELNVVFQVDKQGGEEEIMLSARDLEVYFYDGVELDLGALVRNELSLQVPFAPVCAEPCLDICPACGKLLVDKACDCRVRTPDPRWAKLAGLKLDQ